MNYRKGLRLSEITPMLQFFIAGIFCGEAYAVARVIGTSLNRALTRNHWELQAALLGAVGIAICFLYMWSRDAHTEVKKILVSKRFDLIIIFSAGAAISVENNGLANSFYAPFLEKLSFSQAIYLTLLPLALAIIAMTRAFTFSQIKKPISKSSFLSEKGITGKESDLLNIGEQSETFALHVLNSGATESLVFGVDAPWGAGKTSFIELCCEHWELPKNGKNIILRFEPLRYEDGADLTQKFADELICTIQKHIFSPCIRPLFKRYEKLIKNKTATSILNIGNTLSYNGDTIESIYEEISYHLKNINHRIIIIIDDLDRLHWSSVKSILFSIKRSFTLPNISYVLCYDTTNIKAIAETPDSEKTLDFLEKFINIKTSIFISPEDLSNYITKYFKHVLEPALDLSGEATEQLKSLLNELKKIFDGDDFHLYTPFVGDIRKIKRITNTLTLLNIHKTDFNENDFNKSDLLHLVLIYIYYPSMFRKIYESETGKKSGTFSVIHKGKKLENSQYYLTYKENLPHENQRFLLSKVFDAPAASADSFTEADLSSRAIFQEKHRPLEKYLHLIARLSKPDSWKSYRSYTNKIEKLLERDEVTPHMDSLSKKQPLDEELGVEKFWRILTTKKETIPPKKSIQLIEYLIEKLPEQSLIKNDYLNEFRATSTRLVARLIDERITSDSSPGGSRLSSSELAITSIIFGEKNNENRGILQMMASPERGILGFYDLLNFRHHCKMKTDSERLWRALALHGNLNPSFSSEFGAIKDQARELSQIIFGLFKHFYIDKKINFIDEIESIHDELLGRYKEDFQQRSHNDALYTSIKSKTKEIKYSLISQLGNKVIGEFGIYDETGSEDKEGISKLFSQYLFSVCFNPESSKGLIYFCEYLLMFTNTYFRDRDDIKYEASLNNILHNLDHDELKKFWVSHGEKLKHELAKGLDHTVQKSGSILSFREELPPIYRALDTHFIELTVEHDTTES